MKLLKSKTTLISVFIILLLVSTSSFGVPKVQYSSNTISILYDSSDDIAKYTSKKSFNIIEKYGYQSVEINPIHSLTDFKKTIATNPYILILIFHGDRNGIQIGSKKIDWEGLSKILKNIKTKNIIIESCSSDEVKKSMNEEKYEHILREEFFYFSFCRLFNNLSRYPSN
ncbi:MAG: hypothetical protein HGN29_05975 [Asgard group archaeon]|nr:hypothetical protein [Asgard group archaeon]